MSRASANACTPSWARPFTLALCFTRASATATSKAPAPATTLPVRVTRSIFCKQLSFIVFSPLHLYTPAVQCKARYTSLNNKHSILFSYHPRLRSWRHAVHPSRHLWSASVCVCSVLWPAAWLSVGFHTSRWTCTSPLPVVKTQSAWNTNHPSSVHHHWPYLTV